MAALMVPCGLKSFFGLYPESRRFLLYRPPAPAGPCANAGIAAVADSSTAAARALNEIIFGSPVMDRLQTRVGRDELITLRKASVLSGPRAICLQHPMRIPWRSMYGRPTPVPLNSPSNKSTRLETRVTGSIACGPAFAHNKADCGATERRGKIMPREHGGDSTPEGSSIPRGLVI